MPPEKGKFLKEWLHKASNDLGVCELILSSHARFFETVSFHAQQSAEKSLKAFLTFHDIRFSKTHDLKRIGQLVLKIDASLQEIIQKAELLTPFAVGIRYPGEDEDEPLTLEKSMNHFAIAKEIYEEILKRIPKEARPS